MKEDRQTISEETQNYALDKINELMKRFEDRPTLENLRLSERYIKGEFNIIVIFTIPGLTSSTAASASWSTAGALEVSNTAGRA